MLNLRLDKIAFPSGRDLTDFCDALKLDFDARSMDAGLDHGGIARWLRRQFRLSDIYQEHAYLVRLTKGREAKVQVFEVFGRPPTEGECGTGARDSLALRSLARGVGRVSGGARGQSSIGA